MNNRPAVVISTIVVKNLMKALIAANRRIKALELQLQNQQVKETSHG